MGEKIKKWRKDLPVGGIHSWRQGSSIQSPGEGLYSRSRVGQQASRIRSLTNRVAMSSLHSLPESLAAGLNIGLQACNIDRGYN